MFHFDSGGRKAKKAGVRQGCVLSPRLFSAILEFAMFSWRAKIEAYGLKLHDGMKALLDLRFAVTFWFLQRVGIQPYGCWRSW